MKRRFPFKSREDAKECPACGQPAVELAEPDTGDDSAGMVIVSITCDHCGHCSGEMLDAGEFGGDE